MSQQTIFLSVGVQYYHPKKPQKVSSNDYFVVPHQFFKSAFLLDLCFAVKFIQGYYQFL